MDLNSSSEDEEETPPPPQIVPCRTPSDMARADPETEIRELPCRAVEPGDDHADDGTSAFVPVTPRADTVREALLMLKKGDPRPPQHHLNGSYWASRKHTNKRSAAARAAEAQQAMDFEESYPAVFFKIGGQRCRLGASPLSPQSTRADDEDAAHSLLALDCALSLPKQTPTWLAAAAPKPLLPGWAHGTLKNISEIHEKLAMPVGAHEEPMHKRIAACTNVFSAVTVSAEAQEKNAKAGLNVTVPTEEADEELLIGAEEAMEIAFGDEAAGLDRLMQTVHSYKAPTDTTREVKERFVQERNREAGRGSSSRNGKSVANEPPPDGWRHWNSSGATLLPDNGTPPHPNQDTPLHNLLTEKQQRTFDAVAEDINARLRAAAPATVTAPTSAPATAPTTATAPATATAPTPTSAPTSAPNTVGDSDDELERIVQAATLPRGPNARATATATATVAATALKANGQQERLDFTLSNKRTPFDPAGQNPKKVLSRGRLDTAGKQIRDPDLDTQDRGKTLSIDERKMRSEEFLHLVLPVPYAKSGDAVRIVINDGFSAQCNSETYTHLDQAYNMEVPKAWPRMKAEQRLVTALPLKNWHLRTCPEDKKWKWVYSNYGHSATVVEVCVLRAVYDPHTKSETCFNVQPPCVVRQGPNGTVVWPKDVVNLPPSTALAVCPTESLDTATLQWFNAKISWQKKEHAKRLLAVDLTNDAPAPAAAPAAAPVPAPTDPAPREQREQREQQALLRKEMCAHLLNAASGTFDNSVPSAKSLPVKVDYSNPDMEMCANKLAAMYALGVAAADKSLEQRKRRLIVELNAKVHACTDPKKWSGLSAVNFVGMLLDEAKTATVRERCSGITRQQLFRRAAFIKLKKHEYLAGKKAFVDANMDPRDYPLAMSWIEPFWQALSSADKALQVFA